MDEHHAMTITPSMEKFIASWGEMAGKWSINRTVAEVHALFFLSKDPLNAEDIARGLSFSRSNVSASLRELEALGLIRPIHIRGERKQYFEAKKDPWQAFRVILDDHKRRVIDPTVAVFRMCLEEQTQTAPEDPHATERMRDTVEFFDAVDYLYTELRRLPNGPIRDPSEMVAKIGKVIG